MQSFMYIDLSEIPETRRRRSKIYQSVIIILDAYWEQQIYVKYYKNVICYENFFEK